MNTKTPSIMVVSEKLFSLLLAILPVTDGNDTTFCATAILMAASLATYVIASFVLFKGNARGFLSAFTETHRECIDELLISIAGIIVCLSTGSSLLPIWIIAFACSLAEVFWTAYKKSSASKD